MPNGLCLCQIHHAAYNQSIVGISRDHLVDVRADPLEEIDRPMLQRGPEELHEDRIVLPRRLQDGPDREKLAVRFQELLKAV